MKNRNRNPLRLSAAVVLILTLAGLVQAQNNEYAAPVKWQPYAYGKAKISFSMPKLPLVYSGGNNCRGETSVTFGSYARGVVYQVKVTTKTSPFQFCREKKNFDEKNFRARVAEIEKSFAAPPAAPDGSADSNELKFSSERQILRLVNQYEKRRWIEVSVTGDVDRPEAKRFLESLKTSDTAGAVEIGKGALTTLGDETDPGSTPSEGIENERGSVKEQNLALVVKPRASYTDSARQNGVMGTVVLRATFLPNGGMGAVSVIKGLPHGLTEQATESARRILFIPARRNGVPISVTKTIEYSFTIY